MRHNGELRSIYRICMDIIFLYLFLGVIAGVISGLFGIGGGIIIVPILIFTFSSQVFPTEILTHMAIGTSLATIIITSMSSIFAHHKRGLVAWPIVLWFSPGICLGAILGASFAISITGILLQLFFGIFLCFIGVLMTKPTNPSLIINMPGSFGKTIAGSVIGFFSSIFGIGGGSLSVPYFSWTQIPIKNAIATSAACGLPIAVSGAIVYAIQGLNVYGLPKYTVGFVYLPAFFGIIITSIVFAKVGAKLAYQLPSKALKMYFSFYYWLLGYILYGKISYLF